ncbi:MAG TPA: ABC transporter permease [Nocardioides sp.]
MSISADSTELRTEPDSPRVRDRADLRRQVKLVVLFAIAAVILLLFALSIDEPTVRYSLSDVYDPSQNHDANGLAVVWVTFALAAAAMLGSLLNVIPKGWPTAVVSVVVGLGFYVGLTFWYFADQPGDLASSFVVTNPLPQAVNYATPLVLGALAGVLCERAGVINIAIEAQLLAGAFFASVASSMAFSSAAGLLGGILAGVAFAALLGVFALKYQVNQVVLGVVLIALALGLTDFLLGQIPSSGENKDLNTLLSAPVTMEKVPLGALADIPILGSALFNQTVLVYIMYVSVVLVWFLLYHTTWGLRVRAVGEHPKAADTVGIRVNRVRWSAVLLGGVFAGLGGVFFTVGSTGAFTNNASNGAGFMALAAVIMGRWHPVGATCAALFFGLMLTTQDQFGVMTKFPTELLGAAPYLATLIAVAGVIGRVRPPAADGEPYVKG